MRKTLLMLTALLGCVFHIAIQAEAKSAIEWNRSTFQAFSDFQVMSRSGQERHAYRLTYPRVKQLANGDLIMFFQDGQQSWDILYMRSPDGGKTWSKPQYLAEQQPVVGDTRCFATADAIQLRNGWLVVAYSFRYNADFKRSNDNSGIEVRISKDNGFTWGKPIIAYRGANWEPSLLELPSGELQIYYTQRGPYHESALNDPRFSVDVGLVRSYDNGYTWTPKVDGPPWRGERLSQNEGQDGMAVAVALKNDKGIAYVNESWHASNTGPWVVWSSMEANWRYPEMQSYLNAKGEPNFGPWDRRWVVHKDFRGWAPYMVQMETGETIVSSNGNWRGGASKFHVFVGDDEAKNFADPSVPFAMSPGGWWGSLAIKDQNTLIATATLSKGKDIYNGWDDLKHILYTEGHFIRDFEAPPALDIKLDGRHSEGVWDAKGFLFMGSDSQANSYIKAAYDTKNMYLGIETHDQMLWLRPDDPMKGDSVTVYLDQGSKRSASMDGVFRLDIAPDYIVVERSDGAGSWVRVGEQAAQVRHVVDGKPNDNAGSDVGYMLEAAIPWSTLGGIPVSSQLGVTAVLHNNDTGRSIHDAHDIVGDTVTFQPSTWFTLTLAGAGGVVLDSALSKQGAQGGYWFTDQKADVFHGVAQYVRTGRPVTSAQLWLMDFGGATVASDITTSAGKFSLAVAPGRYALQMENAEKLTLEDDWFILTPNPNIAAAITGTATEFLNIAPMATVTTSPANGLVPAALTDGLLNVGEQGGWVTDGAENWVRLNWDKPQRARSLLVYTAQGVGHGIKSAVVRLGDETSQQPLYMTKVEIAVDATLPTVVPLPEDKDVTWLEFSVDEPRTQGSTVTITELAVVGYPEGRVWFSSPAQREALLGDTTVRVEAPGLRLEEVEIQLDGAVIYQGTGAPMNLQIRAMALSQGPHSITLNATDASGNKHSQKTQFVVEHVRIAESQLGKVSPGELSILIEPVIPAEQIASVTATLAPALMPAAQPGMQHMAINGVSVPLRFVFNTLSLPDDAYDLTVKSLSIDGVASTHVQRIVVDNWQSLEDAIKAPEVMGWFGVVEHMQTTSRTTGWRFVGGNPEIYFGDANRIMSDSDADEQLTWRLPKLQRFMLTLYAQVPDVVEHLQAQFSEDGEHWIDAPYTVEVLAVSPDDNQNGPLKLGVKGEVSAQLQASYFRVVFAKGSNLSGLTLGHVRLDAYR